MKSDAQAVVFDLDGTLLDRRRSFERFARDQWARFAHALHGVPSGEFIQALIRLDGDGYGPRQELFTGLVAHFSLPRNLADTLLTDYRGRLPDFCMLFPDVRTTLAALRASSFKLGLITNGSVSMQSRKLGCLFAPETFDAILISAAEGVSKPDREIFRRAAARLDVDPARTVFVGDHPQVDVAGARAAGMRAVWRRDPTDARQVEADGTIEEIGPLLALLSVGAV